MKMFRVSCSQQQRYIFVKICRNVCQNSKKNRRFVSTFHLPYALTCDKIANSLHHRCCSSGPQLNLAAQNTISNLNEHFKFHNEWPAQVKRELLQDMIVSANFITETEEQQLVAEAEKTMKRARMRYQYDHWDDAIHGYREIEKIDWSPENEIIFHKIRKRAFVANVLPHVHILDLAADGIIKPHVDSSRYCGSTIAGLSLLTDCIMRLKRVDENQYIQSREGDNQTGNSTKNRPKPNIQNEEKNELNYFVDILLKQRSLYIMKDSARYKFSHEVLATKSTFNDQEIIKDRRISIICRNQA